MKFFSQKSVPECMRSCVYVERGRLWVCACVAREFEKEKDRCLHETTCPGHDCRASSCLPVKSSSLIGPFFVGMFFFFFRLIWNLYWLDCREVPNETARKLTSIIIVSRGDWKTVRRMSMTCAFVCALQWKLSHMWNQSQLFIDEHLQVTFFSLFLFFVYIMKQIKLSLFQVEKTIWRKKMKRKM